MNEKDFWIQVRRGLLTISDAIAARWNLPRVGLTTLGATPHNNEASHHSEPPHTALAQSSKEGPR